MGDLPPNADADGLADKAKPSQIVPLKIFGAEIPLPWWAVSVVAVVGIIALAAMLAISIRYHQRDQATNEKLVMQERTLKEQEKKLQEKEEDLRLRQFEFVENQRHLPEPFTTTNVFKRPKLVVRFYNSDRCVLVLRETETGTISKWFPDPPKIQASPPKPKEGASLLPPLMVEAVARHSEDTALQRQALMQPIAFSPSPFRHGGQMVLAQQGPPCPGACMDPHPGEFSSWEGTRQNCWVQVWRRWPDGCTHYQWYNACYSYWESDQSGRPRLNWTCCTHPPPSQEEEIRMIYMRFAVDPKEDKASVGVFTVQLFLDGRSLLDSPKSIGAGERWDEKKRGANVPLVPLKGAKLGSDKKLTLTVSLGDIRGPGNHNNCVIRSIGVSFVSSSGRKFEGSVGPWYGGTPGVPYYFETDNSGKNHGNGTRGGRASETFVINMNEY